ncbi:MAG: AAA-like domain-containing protein [Lachnospiraceae bacterium]|nr:AAA-like domain-containing protein [Lachnospiraceae bacterium]
MKTFNTAVVCNPKKHYMIDITNRIDRIIKNYIDPGNYFAINRGRQYGKTTTLCLLAEKLREKYYCLQISFEGGEELFRSDYMFASGVMDLIEEQLELEAVPEQLLEKWKDAIDAERPFQTLGKRITELCRFSDRPIVLMIDEVDRASDNQRMISFLGMLRDKYIKRESGRTWTFQSVILAGVYDIKNLKLKIRSEESHQYNSPWNVAVKFKEDLSFTADEIAGMLSEYERDYHTDMDVREISRLIFEYTSGYPVLVSGICKQIDENLAETSAFPNRAAAWVPEGVTEAVRLIEHENQPLFEDMIKQLKDFPQLKDIIRRILFEGESIAFNAYNDVLNLARMFDYVKSVNGRVAVANRIFEVVLYDYFLSEEETGNITKKDAELNRSQFIVDGRLDMELLLRKFAEHYAYVYADNDQKFVEKYARKIFLMYLKPVINGTGNYYIEAQTRDEKKTDIIVDYHAEQFLIETKIWYGQKYNEDGEKQLCGYLDRLQLKKGYMLTFSFNKNKKTGVQERNCGEKVLWEITV